MPMGWAGGGRRSVLGAELGNIIDVLVVVLEVLGIGIDRGWEGGREKGGGRGLGGREGRCRWNGSARGGRGRGWRGTARCSTVFLFSFDVVE